MLALLQNQNVLNSYKIQISVLRQRRTKVSCKILIRLVDKLYNYTFCEIKVFPLKTAEVEIINKDDCKKLQETLRDYPKVCVNPQRKVR